MNILILNGSLDLNYAAFDRYMHNYQLKLHHLGHYVKAFQLRTLDISHNNGYTGVTGDINYIFNSLNDADLVVFACPLINGHISDLISKIQDSIVLHFQQMQKKSSNFNFTEVFRMPLFGVVVMPESGSNEHELLLNKLTQERIATNIRTILSFFITTSLNQADAVCETLESAHYRDAYNDAVIDCIN